MSDETVERVLAELDPEPAASALSIPRRQVLRTLAAAGALGAAPGGVAGQAGTVRADEGHLAGYGSTSTANGWELTVDGATFSFDGSETIGLPGGADGTTLVTPSGTEASTVIGPDGQEVLVPVPDSDLSQYLLTDPDGRITVDSPSQYTAVLPNGANEVARLYQSADLSNYDTLTCSFDFDIQSWSRNSIVNIVWATDADSTLPTTTVAGLSIGVHDGVTSDLRLMSITGSGTSGQNDIVGSSVSTGTYSAELTFDTTTSNLTVEVFDSGGSSLGSDVRSLPSGLSHHYAFMGADLGFSTPGSTDLVVSNVSFSTP